MKPEIIGHRGCMGIEPENTLLGIRKAIELVVDGVEIDVHLSKDRELVVIHDEKVDRTTNGHGFVKDMKLSELKKLDAGKGEKIPTLQEVVDITKGKVFLVIELKAKGTEKHVVRIIKKNNLKKVMVISFIHGLVKKIKEMDKSILTGVLIACNPVDPAAIAEAANAELVAAAYKWVDKEFVKKCHKEGIKVNLWNIDNLEDLKIYSKLDADMIATNRPDIAVDYYKKWKLKK